MQELPILKYRQHIIEALQKNSVLIVCGQTGSGKTTQLPQFLFPYFNSIMISQPRRISAITLAERVAEEMKVEIGQQIGYNVRFEQKRSAKTKVTFVTDGMAIRELMIGINYDVFVLDQAHERSINTDVLMAVLKKRMMNQDRKPFKLVIMSATIDASKFMAFFNSNALIKIEGRTFPTEVYNIFEPIENYVQGVFNTILQIHYQEEPGNILAFLTGEDQIVSLYKRLQKVKEEYKLYNIKIFMLYSALPHQYQHQIFEIQTNKDIRRVILATNIAETSVTIPGVRYVVDSGFMKIRIYDNSKLLDMLTIVPVSKANALQRAGRAGRQFNGKCYRLYPKNSYEEMKQQTNPEILRSQLSGPVLQLKAVGIAKIKELEFMDQPGKETIEECLKVLREMKCLTNEPHQQITAYGKQVSKIPLPPRLAHLLLLSVQFKCEGLMLSMLSILSIDNLFLSSAVSEKGNKKTNLYEVLSRYLPVISTTALQTTRLITSDHLAKINILHQYMETSNKNVFCKQNHINKNNIKRAVMIRDQLNDYLEDILKNREKINFLPLQQTQNKKNTPKMSIDQSSLSQWLKCMQKGCFYMTAKLNQQGKYTIFHSGQVASIHPESLCFYLPQKPKLIVFSQVVKTNKIYMKDITPLPS